MKSQGGNNRALYWDNEHFYEQREHCGTPMHEFDVSEHCEEIARMPLDHCDDTMDH